MSHYYGKIFSNRNAFEKYRANDNIQNNIRVFPREVLYRNVWDMMPQLWNAVSFFLYVFLSQSDFFYLLIVGLEGYCCIWSCSVTHTHTLGGTPLEEGSDCRGHLHVTTHNTHNRQTDNHALERARTRNPRKRAAADRRLRLHGH